MTHQAHADRPAPVAGPGRCAWAAGNDRREHAQAGHQRRLHDLPPHRPGAKGPDGLPPIGPAWRDVSAKYKGQKDAATS
jgi:hypothetical protein